MRKYLAIGALLTMSICVIGSPEPDRPSPDEIVLSEQASFDAQFVMTINATPSFDETELITEQEAVSTDLFLVDSVASVDDISFDLEFAQANLNSERLQVIELGDLVVEDDKHKPRDRYRLPIYDYEPIAEPPAVTKS